MDRAKLQNGCTSMHAVPHLASLIVHATQALLVDTRTVEAIILYAVDD